MLQVIDKDNIEQLQTFLESREVDADPKVIQDVQTIIQEVIKNKDRALFAYAEKFDGVKLDSLVLTKGEIDTIAQQVDAQFLKDLQEAAENITYYHNHQIQKGYELQKDDGVYMGQKVLPLENVGVYVPAGLAAYPSSVLMNVIPAKIAGVKNIVMCTPPNKDGSVNPYIVAAAKIAGVDKICKVGGAQAIAAMAYGSESVACVDKIVGPGNIYVASAKRLVYGKVDIDMIAGPSEILVIADEKANPKYIAADLISQAEHDPLASSILVCTSHALVERVCEAVKKQVETLPKKDIIKASFDAYGCAIVCDTMQEAISISNQIAPEHLELMVEDAKSYLDQIKNAGSIFLGYYTCESIGDYFGGTNHVLPTNGTARFYSPLSCDSFIKKSSYIHYSKEALMKDGAKIMNIAYKEQLAGHANAVKVRLEDEECGGV